MFFEDNSVYSIFSAIREKKIEKVKEVKVMNGGSGFHETPILKIESPNSSNGCFLCCK